MKTILVLDDEARFRQLLCLVLTRRLTDCAVLDGQNGEEGVAILNRSKVDLIVTDLKMPRLDGFGVIEQAKRLDPAIPLYIITGFCNPQCRERLARAGISRYFEKPFSMETLAELVAADLGLSLAA